MKTITQPIVAAALSALVLAGAGCKDTTNTVRISDDGRYEWIQTDSELARVADIKRVSKQRVDDLLRVSVELMNTTDDRRVVKYRFTWLDQDNMPIPTPLTTWKREFLNGQQITTLSAIGPDSRATDVRLEMILSDD